MGGPSTALNGAGVAGQAAVWNSSGTGIVNNPIYRSLTLAGDASMGGLARYAINGGTVDGSGTTFNGGRGRESVSFPARRRETISRAL